jgi:hypothetical protein
MWVSNCSQFEEMAFSSALFSLISMKLEVRRVCAGNGRCATNLIINYGWWGYLFDGMDANDASTWNFANNKDTFLHPPKFWHGSRRKM